MQKYPTLLRGHRAVGFTLFELLITLAILGILSAVALPSYQEYVEDTNNQLAAGDLVRIDQALEVYYDSFASFPPSLAEAGVGGMLDPWDNPYQFLRIDADTKKGSKRKDKNLNPVNSDYDLYSMGADGSTSMPFTSAKGRDDIVRANNARYYGLAENY